VARALCNSNGASRKYYHRRRRQAGNAHIHLKRLLDNTDYQNHEIVVLDNSKRSEIESLVNHFRGQSSQRLRYIDWRQKTFNYSVINNEAARHCDSPLLLFLNDDTSVISGAWLNTMTELAWRTEVGGVGAKLLSSNGRIQHAGVGMGLFDNCGHAFKGLKGDHQHTPSVCQTSFGMSALLRGPG